MSYEITDVYDEPYSQSTSALPSSFSPSVVGVAGVPYLMDTSEGKYSRQAFDVVQQRNTTDNRDILLLPQDVWRQQSQSWHQGAGQSNLDRDDALLYRYDSSFGADPWTQWRLSILPETERLYRTELMSGDIWLTTHGEYLAVVNDEYVYWYTTLGSASAASVGTTQVYAGHNVIDIANTGAVVTTLHDDGHIYTSTPPSLGSTNTGSEYSNKQYTSGTFIAWEKDYLLVGDGNVLKWVKTGNQDQIIFTHPDSSFRWYSAASGDSCIYVLGRVQDKTYIHRVNIVEQSAGTAPTLNSCIVAAQLPDGEYGYSIETYLGFVLIGTDRGVRIAKANNTAGDLTLGPILPTNAPVRCFEGQDRFVWYGVTEMDGSYQSNNVDNQYFPADPVRGLGRIDLSVSTLNELTPAYANDIVAQERYGDKTPIQDKRFVTDGDVISVTTFANKRVFSVENSGVFYQADTLMDYAWLKQGIASFSVEDKKTGLYVQLKWEPLQGEIGVDISFDSAGYRRISDYTVQFSIRSDNTNLGGRQFSRYETRYVLKRDTDTVSTPQLTRFEMRAIPVKGRSSRWTLPIMNYEELEIDMVKYTRDCGQVLDTLIGLVENGTIFLLQEGGRSYQVHGKDFLWQPEKLTINGKAWQGVFTLVVEEVS